MDIEGAECMALQGCMELFAKADHLDSRSVRIIKKLMSSNPGFFWTGLIPYSFTDGYMFVNIVYANALSGKLSEASS